MTVLFATDGVPIPVEENVTADFRPTPQMRQDIARIRARKLRVLLVEDHPDYREILIKMLDKIFGVSVTPFGAAEPALELLRSNAPSFHMILFDIVLPRMLGIDACKEIKARGTKARIVLMTGANDPAYIQQARAVDIPLLLKPLEPAHLLPILLKCGDDAS